MCFDFDPALEQELHLFVFRQALWKPASISLPEFCYPVQAPSNRVRFDYLM